MLWPFPTVAMVTEADRHKLFPVISVTVVCSDLWWVDSSLHLKRFPGLTGLVTQDSS